MSDNPANHRSEDGGVRYVIALDMPAEMSDIDAVVTAVIMSRALVDLRQYGIKAQFIHTDGTEQPAFGITDADTDETETNTRVITFSELLENAEILGLPIENVWTDDEVL